MSAMLYGEYPDTAKLKAKIDEMWHVAMLKHEYGSKGIHEIYSQLEKILSSSFDEIKNLPIDEGLAAKEPNDLESIRALREDGPRRLWSRFDEDLYRERVEGALLARLAGCVLGAPVEHWKVEDMESFANKIGDPFPPVDYWSEAKTPRELRYFTNTFAEYTRDGMDGCPVDDDIIYTLFGLLFLEKYGTNFTTEDVGKAWNELLPWVWLDMQIPLDKYLQGTPAEKAADDNPFCQMICAGIRCDPYGYAIPGNPERAAGLAYRDARMSHRRNGIYGSMFFTAAISAAFAVDDPIEAVKIGLTEIPRESSFARAIRWALDASKDVKNYRDARAAVDEYLKGMHPAHIINNACLTVFGLAIGRTDVTKVISETVAMGMDNDCTAATAGSIVGAVVGKKGVPEHWYKPFNNFIHSYIRGHERFHIDDVVNRYTALAMRLFE